MINQIPLRIAAIRFLNPAPLMWDFTHPPHDAVLANRYRLDWMLPSACAEALIARRADLGLVPIATLATNPELQIVPGCTIASKADVRSLILVRRAGMSLEAIRTVAADSASRSTLAYTQTLFKLRGIRARFVPAAANLNRMLASADAAMIIGDAALLAIEEINQSRNQPATAAQDSGELLYHDLAGLWRETTGLAWVSAVWAAGPQVQVTRQLIDDLNNSRIHGSARMDELAGEWSQKLPLGKKLIRDYLTKNIHYELDQECIDAMRGFFRLAAEQGVLPSHAPRI